MGNDRNAIDLALHLLDIPFCPWTPAPAQASFLLDLCYEAFYGGAAGGGKSVSLLMGASQFLQVPEYSALLLRKTFADLSRPGALLDLAESWWGPYMRTGEVKFDRANHIFSFACPDGGWSRIEFGALDDANARLKYQGGMWQFLGLDELTQFKENDYVYLFSRLRRPSTGPLAKVPIRVRGTGNPGGPGAQWVHSRLVAPAVAFSEGEGPEPERHFHPASLADNPHLDREEYERALGELDPVTRAQLRDGDWLAGQRCMFDRDGFIPITRAEIPGSCRWVRAWDMAATAPRSGTDPDYTVGVLMGKSLDGRYFIADVRRWQDEPAGNDRRLSEVVHNDSRRVDHVIQQDPGGAGKSHLHHLQTGPFASVGLKAVPSSRKGRSQNSTIDAVGPTSTAKILAATPLASSAQAGEVFIVVDGSWDDQAFLREVVGFPNLNHDDQVDSASLALNHLSRISMYAPRFGSEVPHVGDSWVPAPVLSSLDHRSLAEYDSPADRFRRQREQDELGAKMRAIYGV